MKYLYIFLLISLHVIAQSPTDTLKKYNVTKLLEIAEIAENNKLSAHHYYKEILKRNPSDFIKAKTYYAIGNYYHLNIEASNIDSAIIATIKGQKYAEKSGNYVYNVMCLINLSGFYAMKNENDKAFENFMKARVLQEKNKDNNYERLRLSGDRFEIYYLLGDFSKEISGNKRTILEIDAFLKTKSLSTNQLFELNKTKLYLYRKLANNYCYLKKLDSVSFYLQRFDELNRQSGNLYNIWPIKTFYYILSNDNDKALNCLENAKEEIAISKIYTYLSLYYKALCFNHKKDYKKSLAFCEDALKVKVTSISYVNYELELYKLATENAQILGLTKKENLYLKKYNEGAQKINYQEKAAFMAKLYDQDVVKPLNEELIAKEKKTYYLWSGLTLVLVLSGGYIAYGIYKSKKEKAHFDALIAKLEREKEQYQNAFIPKEIEFETVEENTELFEELPENSTSKVTISEETEKKILKKLENFERRQMFLSPETSLSKIAQDFKTNAFYISHVVKKHKNTNLNSYINKLRIDYITHKLKFNSEYMNYKIEYLAQESGFSSYSTFKRIFTKETGIDPSKFIEYLKKVAKLQE